MEFLVEDSNAKRRRFLTAIMPSMIDQLGLTNSRKAVLVRVADECEGMGMTVPLDALDSYVVIVKPAKLSTVGVTLAHEMVHVRQLAKGILKLVKGKTHWRGRRVSAKVKYLNQPWELDAFAKQEIVFRRSVSE